MSKENCGPVNCRDCANLARETESWEMPHIFWFECVAKPHVANLTSFPFKSTQCKEFKRREKPMMPQLSEILDD